MKFFKKDGCQCGVCGNTYNRKPLISNQWNERVECCSYECYLHAIGFYSPQSEYYLTFRQRSMLLKNLLRKASSLFKKISSIKIIHRSNEQFSPQPTFFHRHT